MKFLFAALLLFGTQLLYAQNYSIEIKSGNHDDIITADYDRQKNELIALDKLGFIVCWNMSNYSIINKFQLPPEGPYSSSRKDMIGKYEVKAYDSIIVLTYPFNYNNYNNGARLVDVYHRKTGAFIMQTPLAKISAVVFTKNGTMITATATTTKQGYIESLEEATLISKDVKGRINSIDLYEVPTYMETDEQNKRLAIGYRNGKVEVRDLQTLKLIKSFNDFENDREKKISQLLFIPGSNKLAYTVEYNGKIIIRDIVSGILTDSMQLEETNYRLAVSPSGKYFTALRSGYLELDWRDLQKKSSVKRSILDHRKVPGLFLNEVFFLNDNLLIGAGRNSLTSQHIQTNGIGNVGAWLGLIDTKRFLGSVNLNIITASEWMQGYGSNMHKPSSLVTVLHGFSDEFAYTDPAKLMIRSGKLTEFGDQLSQYLSNKEQRQVYTSSLQKTGSSSAPDFIDKTIAATLFNGAGSIHSATDTFYLAYYNFAADSFVKATKLVIPNKDVYYYDLRGVLHKPGLSFFTHRYHNEDEKNATELVIFNENGIKIFTDTIVENFVNKTIALSHDHQYYAYQPEPGSLVVRSVKDHSLVHRIKVGFTKEYNVTGYANPVFIPAKPNVLVHEVSGIVNNSTMFCLMATDVVSKRSDTLFNFSLRPQSYELDTTASIISLVYNYDFTDSAFTNAEVVQNAALQSFKPLYKPTVLLYSVKEKDIISAINTGKTGIASAALKDQWLTVMQHNGQLLYINTQNTQQKISHILDGQSQALVADSFYYASHNLLPLINLKTDQGNFSVTQADIFLNKPHQVLKLFTKQHNEMIKPYEMAYLKRRQQHVMPNEQIAKLFTKGAGIETNGSQQSYVYTEERKIDLPFIINDKKAVTHIRVSLNGQPVMRYNGTDVKKVIAQQKLPFELSQGENYITINAETADGKPIEPVKYYYYCEPKQYTTPKLFFFSAGVSNYKDSSYNLKYAAKDANDIFQAFRYKVVDTLISEILTDKEVTQKNINAWEKQIQKAGVDDVVILYFAGHGLLDTKNNFYYAMHDMDFQQPQKNGLSYQAILDLLNKSPSRKKILLLDACHSGAFDRSVAKEMIQPVADNDVKVVNVQTRSTIKGAKPPYSERQAFVLMNQVFADLSADIGIDVIAASLGNSYALEQEKLQNGLFTYAMIRAVALGMAAGGVNESQTITMEQVKKFIEKEVTRLSRGEQVPSIRASNVQSGSIEFHHSWKYDEAFTAFIERYK